MRRLDHSTFFPYTSLYRSDLRGWFDAGPVDLLGGLLGAVITTQGGTAGGEHPAGGGPSLGDRKSTRLNSSHVAISYAVFCLKKKKLRKDLQLIESIMTHEY